ncbi:unnamed protein product [Peronospora belbahrii]|uniref:SAC3/GANP/THP3 conserved domain-containing protein n=1 Tax=Peronospora belbahrii TaxID=622444 RepID=A0AAU9KI27_9STRA|nr:unnamed protein product [Peronospora belbahrii]
MFSSSTSNNEFESFEMKTNHPFGHDTEGSIALNPFHSRDGDDSALKTTFGQSFGVTHQPSSLPPGGLAGDLQISNNGFENQPSCPSGRLASAPFMASGGSSTAAVGGIPFGQPNQNMAQNNSSNTFGSTSFEPNNAFSSSTLTGAQTTFGYASNVKHRSAEFGRSLQNSRLRDDGVLKIFGENSTAFGENDNGFGRGQTAFGAPRVNREDESFVQEPKGRKSSHTTAPAPSALQGAAFESQGSDVRVRKRQIASNAASVAPVDNPFTVAAADGYDTTNVPVIHTTFGEAVDSFSAKASAALRKSSFGGSAASTTTFGAINEDRRQSGPKFGSEAISGGFSKSDKTASMEERVSGAKKVKKTPSGNRKRGQGYTVAEEDAMHFGGQATMSRHSHKYPSGEDTVEATKVMNVKPAKEKHGKHRQARPKKKVPSISDEETPFVPMPPNAPSGRDENTKAQLSAATNLDGLCADMCSPGERELHIRVDELSVFEKCYPDQPGRERDMIIKRFQRSSADHKLDIPEEIRPPGVLRRTQLYIEQAIMDLDQYGLDPRFQFPRVPEPIELYNFCWDRFRMIRKDFILQNYRGAGGRVHPIALDVHERIARYHVLSEHELIETPSFVAQQNMEQLGQTLKSLNELYDESYKVGDPAYLSPFEAECRAYFVLCTLDNGRGMDVLKYVKNLPYHILQSTHIEFAMRVFVARHTGDYFQFFLLLREATYLQSCLIFRYIPSVRSSALLRMNRAFRGQTYPLEDLVDLLCFDDIEHAYAVCREHQLRISGEPGVTDDTAIMVKFGGDFQTDTQLRRNNTPLKVRASKIFVGMKQGNFLRRDVCRGVTEFAEDKYPALSKLIEDIEMEEQARLYPDRPVYDDDHSYFIDYNGIGFVSPPMSPELISTSNVSSEQEPAETDQKRDDFGMIAQRKHELEQEKQVMLERMRKLEQMKEEAARRDKAKNTAAEEAAQRDELTKLALIAQVKAEKEAAEAKQRQQELEIQLREQTKQRAELEQQRKRAEEAAREADRQRLAAIQQAEVMKMKEELAETRARQAREAAKEAQRQAQLAKEQAERKKARRIEKERLAILKLRLHLWKKYVQASRHGTGPILIDGTKLRLDRPHQKAKESIQWLFGKADGGSGALIGTKRPKHLSRVKDVSPSDADIVALWCSEDILELVGPPLRQKNMRIPSVAWKLVIADLLDGSSSSFGLWCAVRSGAQNVSVPEHDCYRVFQPSDDGKEQGIFVCSRYFDSTYTERNTQETLQDKLTATSAILLPVDMSLLQLAGNCSHWEQRVEELLSSLKKPGSRVTMLALGFVSAEVESSRKVLLSMLRSCVERVQSRFASLVMRVDVDLIDASDLSHKFGQVLKKIATLSPPVRHFKSVGLKELVEGSVKAATNQFESSVGIQSNICAAFPRLRDEILTSGVLDLLSSPPELQFAIIEPPHDWNLKERRQEIQSILTALEVTRMAIVDSPLNCDQTCDVYFKKIEDFIDRLFVSHRAATAVSTYELKKRIYTVLLPVHEQLTQNGKTKQVTPQEADALLPWRKIFEEIYATFFETLSDITIYYPADWVQFGAGVSRLLDAAVRSSAPEQFTDYNSRSKRARAKEPVQVSAQSIRRSFGPFHTLDVSKQKYQVVRGMKRLRVEIEKERAAAFKYQHLLRQALKQWDK